MKLNDSLFLPEVDLNASVFDGVVQNFAVAAIASMLVRSRGGVYHEVTKNVLSHDGLQVIAARRMAGPFREIGQFVVDVRTGLDVDEIDLEAVRARHVEALNVPAYFAFFHEGGYQAQVDRSLEPMLAFEGMGIAIRTLER